MAAKYPFISVIVPTRNEEESIAECLDSLINLDYPKNKYEILVSDGRSTDKTREIVKKYRKAKLLDNTGINSAAGRNLGVSKAKGEIIAFTDADCTVAKNWLKILVKNLKPGIVVGGVNLSPEKVGYFSRSVGYALSTFFGSAGSVQSYKGKRKKEVKSVPNANAMYWKRDILKVGGYNEKFATGQDAEMNYRIRQRGNKFMFIPEAKVWHKMRSTPYKFAKRMYQYGYARAQMTKLHRTKLNPAYMVTPMFALFVLLTPVLYNFMGIFGFLWLLYLLFAFIFSIGTGKVLHMPAILLVFFLEHFFYGFGFLVGYTNKL